MVAAHIDSGPTTKGRRFGQRFQIENIRVPRGRFRRCLVVRDDMQPSIVKSPPDSTTVISAAATTAIAETFLSTWVTLIVQSE